MRILRLEVGLLVLVVGTVGCAGWLYARASNVEGPDLGWVNGIVAIEDSPRPIVERKPEHLPPLGIRPPRNSTAHMLRMAEDVQFGLVPRADIVHVRGAPMNADGKSHRALIISSEVIALGDLVNANDRSSGVTALSADGPRMIGARLNANDAFYAVGTETTEGHPSSLHGAEGSAADMRLPQ